MKGDFVFLRQVDRLGRICLPKEMRMAYEMDAGAQVVITPTENGIVLRCLSDAKDEANQDLIDTIMKKLNNN